MSNRSREPLSLGYLAIVGGLMVVVPTLFVLAGDATVPLLERVGRWFVFWGLGARLFTAGVWQIARPSFTAREIFHLESPEVEVVVRELGFANVCMGALGLLSGFASSFRPGAALVGGLYMGLAGVMHAVKRPATPNEWLALVSDVFIALVSAVCLGHAVGAF